MKRLDLLEEKFNFEGKIKKYVFGYQTMVMGPPGGFGGVRSIYLLLYILTNSMHIQQQVK